MTIDQKIERAIRLIQAASTAMNGEPIEVAYSGGKDSDVILKLTQEAGVPYRAIYKCTTIDPPGTIKHANEAGAEIVKPKMTFFELIEKKGFPNRWRRFCCASLKEYKILDKAVIGVRRAESAKRAKRYIEPTQCRIYSKNVKVEQIFPILDWESEDLLWYINDRKIKLHPLYYREDGSIDISRRLGCVGCPLASPKEMRREFRAHPNMVKAYIKHGAIYFNKHRDCNSLSHFDNVYEWFYRHLFCVSTAQFEMNKHTLFGGIDCKEFLEDYFGLKL